MQRNPNEAVNLIMVVMMLMRWWCGGGCSKVQIRSSPVQCIMESDTNVQRTLRAMVLTLAHIFVFVFVFVEQKLGTSLIHWKTSRLQRSIVSLRDLIPLIFKCWFTVYFHKYSMFKYRFTFYKYVVFKFQFTFVCTNIQKCQMLVIKSNGLDIHVKRKNNTIGEQQVNRLVRV